MVDMSHEHVMYQGGSEFVLHTLLLSLSVSHYVRLTIFHQHQHLYGTVE